MAGRERPALGQRGAARARAAVRTPRVAVARPLLYTAQDVARFCEVDLKTIHHWADAGKIAHHRTEGRHLRFRRNHLVQFLRLHGYPLHDAIASARPTVFLAAAPEPLDGDSGSPRVFDELARKLAARVFVRRFDSALAAIANLVAGEPDVLILSLDDPSIAGARTVAALKAEPTTAWPVLVVVSDDPSSAPGAEHVVARAELAHVPAELAATLALD